MWQFYTIIACFLQIFRHLEQKNLSKNFDAITVIWARFLLPLPFVAVFLTYWQWHYDNIDSRFVFYCAIASFFQVVGGLFLLKSFRGKNFNIALTLVHSEVIQAAILGWLFFDMPISFYGWLAIFLVMIAVFLLSNIQFTTKKMPKESSKEKPREKSMEKSRQIPELAVFCGLLAGLCYAIQAFVMKNASNHLINSAIKDANIVAMLLFFYVIIFNNLILLIIKIFVGNIKDDLTRLVGAEGRLAFIRTSLLSFAAGSFWFLAYTIGEVVAVKITSQLEILFGLILTKLFVAKRFSNEKQEKLTKKEIIGIFLLVTGIMFYLIFN